MYGILRPIACYNNYNILNTNICTKMWQLGRFEIEFFISALSMGLNCLLFWLNLCLVRIGNGDALRSLMFWILVFFYALPNVLVFSCKCTIIRRNIIINVWVDAFETHRSRQFFTFRTWHDNSCLTYIQLSDNNILKSNFNLSHENNKLINYNICL